MIPRYLLTLSVGYSGTLPRLHLAIVMVKRAADGSAGSSSKNSHVVDGNEIECGC